MSQSDQSIAFNQDSSRNDLIDEIDRFTAEEAFVFRRWIEGATISEIASEMNESLSNVSRKLKVLQKRVLSRLSREQEHQLGTKVTAPASRLEAFAALQRRLRLTSAKAAEWQNSVHEGRR